MGVVGSVDGGRDETLMTSSLVVTSPPRHTLRHRPPGTLPTHEDSADDLDNLDDVSHTHSGTVLLTQACVFVHQFILQPLPFWRPPNFIPDFYASFLYAQDLLMQIGRKHREEEKVAVDLRITLVFVRVMAMIRGNSIDM